MTKIEIGRIVSTHGVKGEIKIISDFPYKEKAFQVGTNILIEKNKYKIASYRRHKNYDMITLEGYTNINDILFLMKKEVYKEKEALDLKEEEILDSELLEYQVRTTEGQKGRITEIFLSSPKNKILRVEIEKREVLIPAVSPFIEKIDYNKKEIIIRLIKGM